MSVTDEDVIKVVATYDMPGSTIAQNVWHVKYDDGPVVADSVALDAALEWVERMWAQVQPIVADSVALNNVEASKLVSLDPAIFVSLGSLVSGEAGVVATEALPNGVAAVVRASIEGISALARKFIPGIAETKVDEVTWEAVALLDLADFVVEWLLGADVVGGGVLLAGVFSIATEVFKELSGEGAVSTVPGYQRRRKPGVGA